MFSVYGIRRNVWCVACQKKYMVRRVSEEKCFKKGVRRKYSVCRESEEM